MRSRLAEPDDGKLDSNLPDYPRITPHHPDESGLLVAARMMPAQHRRTIVVLAAGARPARWFDPNERSRGATKNMLVACLPRNEFVARGMRNSITRGPMRWVDRCEDRNLWSPFRKPLSATGLQPPHGVARFNEIRIRQDYRPHPRHWQALAKLVGVAPTSCRFARMRVLNMVIKRATFIEG